MAREGKLLISFEYLESPILRAYPCIIQRKTKHSKEETASLLLAFSCTSRHLSCVYEDDQLNGTGGNSNSVSDVGLLFYCRDPIILFNKRV